MKTQESLSINAIELRLTFGGVVLLMFALGILFSLALLRILGRDAARQKMIVASRIEA